MGEPSETPMSELEGIVKWFDPKKGYGFIIGPEGEDVFVHFSHIEGEGFRVLKDGTTVRYDRIRGEKGWHAIKVRRTESLEVKVRPVGGHLRSPRR